MTVLSQFGVGLMLLGVAVGLVDAIIDFRRDGGVKAFHAIGPVYGIALVGFALADDGTPFWVVVALNLLVLLALAFTVLVTLHGRSSRGRSSAAEGTQADGDR